jgi:hypothetical protein
MTIRPPFSCPNPPTAEEIEVYEREGREAALKPDADPLTRFTDGLGALGVGSWRDGPAHYRQKAFNETIGRKPFHVERDPITDDGSPAAAIVLGAGAALLAVALVIAVILAIQ